jgi:hypothetical protein
MRLQAHLITAAAALALAACGGTRAPIKQAATPTPKARATPAPATAIRTASAPVGATTPTAAGLERAADTYVRRFYAQLDAEQFEAAWARLPESVRSGAGSIDAWREGYRTTIANEISDVAVDVAGGSTATVALTLRATDLDACADEIRQRFSVRWILHRASGRWTASSISVTKLSGSTPRLDEETCPEPAPDDDASSVTTDPEDVTAASDDESFCSTHVCIPNYTSGRGTTVMCADGEYSHSGGIQGACSHHGGVAGGTSSRYSTPSSTSGSVQVQGYYRRDGTYVHPYTRRAPCSYC